MRLEKQRYTQLKEIPATGFHEAHYHETLELVKQEMKVSRRMPRRVDKRFLLSQLYKNSLPVGSIQLIVLLLIVCLSGFSQWLNDGAFVLRHLPLVTGVSSSTAAMAGMILLRRARRYQAEEIEMGAYVQRNYLMLIYMGIFSAGNIVTAAVFYLLIRTQTDMNVQMYLLYTVLPYLIAATGCLYIYRYVAAEYSDYASVISAVMLAALVFSTNHYEVWIYQEHYAYIWAVIGLAGVFVAGYHIINELRNERSIHGFNI